MNSKFLQRRILDPIINLLRQGITPEKIALSLAFGICLGVFPVLGTTVLLCTAATWIFRLNFAAIQLVNYLVYPLQLLLIMPFVRMGEFLFHVKPIPFSLAQMITMLRADMLGTIKALWQTSLHAAIAWLVIGPAAIYILYRILLPIITRLADAYAALRRPAHPQEPVSMGAGK